MKKPWLRALLALLVAGVAVFFVWIVLVTYVMHSLPFVVETTMTGSLAIIAAGLCAALIGAWRAQPAWIYRAALAVMLLSGLAPVAVSWTQGRIDDANRKIETARKDEERRAYEAKFLSELVAYENDITARAAAGNPFDPREAQKFLEFVQGSNLNHRSLPDYSPRTFPLLKRALDGKILDPNVRVRGPTPVDVNEEPLFVVYYKFYLKSAVELKRVREREWNLLQMLVAGGANLDDPAAAIVKDQIARETEPYELKGYLRLK